MKYVFDRLLGKIFHNMAELIAMLRSIPKCYVEMLKVFIPLKFVFTTLKPVKSENKYICGTNIEGKLL